MNNIYVTKSALPPIEEYINEISSIWETHFLTNMGPKHNQLENNIKKYMGCSNNVSLFSNGHMALESIIEAMDFPKDSEIITTPFSFASTTNAIVRQGLRPVFCDINMNDFTIDVSKIEDLVTKNTKAILPVHVYGNICDYKEIDRIAKKYNLVVIYDAAHAFGEKIDDLSVADLGDASMFSFHATKVFSSIEGGMVAFKDERLSNKLKLLKNFGVENDDILMHAPNAKMSEFHASMGLCNLRHIEEYIEGRKRVVRQYQENLCNVDNILIWHEQKNVEHNYSYFPVVFKSNDGLREKVENELSKNGIGTRRYFYPLLNNTFASGRFGDNTPIAKYVSENVLSLPLYPDLSLDVVNQISKIIIDFCKQDKW